MNENDWESWHLVRHPHLLLYRQHFSAIRSTGHTHTQLGRGMKMLLELDYLVSVVSRRVRTKHMWTQWCSGWLTQVQSTHTGHNKVVLSQVGGSILSKT